MKRHPAHESLFRALPHTLVIAAALALSACGGAGSDGGSSDGGGGGDGGGSGGLTAGTGSLTLSVTDKPPMPDIIEVNVVFTGITLKPQEGEAISFECGPEFDCVSDGDDRPDARTIDLRALVGDTREIILDAADVPAGLYEWIRLHVDAATPAQGSTGASNVVFAGNPDYREPLVIPSGQQSGLKLVSGFEVPDGGAASFTIDFDLRRGLVWTGKPSGNGNGNGNANANSNGKVMLKPAHRLVDNGGVGVLRGEVYPDFEVVEVPPKVTVSDSDCAGPAAYVYAAEGFSAPGQVGSEDDAPVATTELVPAPTGAPTSNSTYEIGFLEAGDYKVAIACAAEDGEGSTDPVLISTAEPAEIVAGQATRLDFLPPSP